MANTTRRQFKSRMAAKQDVWRAIPALMGDGNGTIEVPNQANMVYIRVGDGDLGQAFNNRCQLRDNLAIFVGYDPVTDPDRRIFQVLSVRMADYAGAGNTTVPNVGPHHTTHEFGGGDDTFIDWRRLMGLRVGRPALFVVTVDPGYIYRAGWIAIPSTTVDLTATHAALVGTQAQYVLISLSSVGAVTATVGAVVISPAALTIADVPVPPAGHIPLAAVRLYKVQTAIGDTPAAPDIIDLRFPTYNAASAYVTPHNVLSASHGDSLAGAVVRGDIIYGNSTPAWARLGLGGISGSVVTRNATDVLWSAGALSFAGAFTLTIPATGTAALGTGTASYVPRWSGANTLGNGVIQDDGTGIVGVNVAPVAGITMTVQGLAATGTYLRCRNNATLDIFSVINVGADNAYITLLGLTLFASLQIAGSWYAYYGNSADYLVIGAGLRPTTIGGIWSDLAASSGCVIAYAADRQQLFVRGHTTQATATPVTQVTRDDAAAGVSAMLGLTALGSGANGDGGSISLNGKTSTTAAQAMGLDEWLWVDATHASRKARRIWSVYDTAIREGLRIEASGSAPMLSFYGGTAVVRGAALTGQLTTITHTAPGTPDYAIQDFAQNGGAGIWGFADHDEANSVLAVIANLQTRVAELEARLGSATGVNLFA